MTIYATDWRAASACLSADPELFFPIPQGPVANQQISAALGVCAGCTVRQQCLDFAMQTAEMHGIWGGTTPEERIRARRKASRRRKERESPAWQTQEVRAS
jgi:WhiB family transcriptional regulator, redox-sensing transcriptional regulator